MNLFDKHSAPTRTGELIDRLSGALQPGSAEAQQTDSSSELRPDPSEKANFLHFDQLLASLEQKGKKQFGPHFKIHPQDYEILFKVMVYFYRDKYHAAKYEFNFRKGLMLSGPVGCGKTSLMFLFRSLKYSGHTYQVVSARDVCIQFMEHGYQALKYYACIGAKTPTVFCFDDLGSETTMKYYGNETNVMAEILLSRYDLFTQRGIPTHITTNLSASELEKLYGNRLRSRMREMFNLVAFEGEDKRV